MSDDAGGKSALSAGLGPRAPMEQLLAFVDWERKHRPHPAGMPHVAEWAAAEIERLRFACASAEQFIAGLRVPQTADAAGLQIAIGGAVLEQLRAVLVGGPNVAFSGVPAGHSSEDAAGGTSAGTQG